MLGACQWLDFNWLIKSKSYKIQSHECIQGFVVTTPCHVVIKLCIIISQFPVGASVYLYFLEGGFAQRFNSLAFNVTTLPKW